MTASGTILAVNAGSSSLKFQLFDHSPELRRLARGSVGSIGGAPSFSATDEITHVVDKKILSADYTHEIAFQLLLDWIHKKRDEWRVKAVVHRVVHGGTLYTQSVLITPQVAAELKTLVPLAPLHMSHNLTAINTVTKVAPALPQIACFDTAFHANHDPLFTTYALPQKVRDKGVRRFGFHGLSYEWIAGILQRDEPAMSRKGVVAAHLGNGASLCAIKNGVSIDTSMGMTALDGLPMGTRSGSLDPGALLYMIRELNMPPEQIEQTLYNESGLLGLSGLTNDVKQLQDSKDNPKAQFALDYFALRVAQYAGMMAVAMGGMGGIVFTGGIGENSTSMREKILARLDFLKPFEVRIIRSNEERMMAIHAQKLLEALQPPKAEEEDDPDEW